MPEHNPYQTPNSDDQSFIWGLITSRPLLIVVVVQVVVALPFWLFSSPAPYQAVFGDVYRGWPFPYGLDQGDVRGDEWGPFITYFHPWEFALDTAAAVVCGLPLTIPLIRQWRRVAGAKT